MAFIFSNRVTVFTACCVLMSGCATTHQPSRMDSVNRGVFNFNETVDKTLFSGEAEKTKHGTDTTSDKAPNFLLRSTSNVLSNLNEPVNFANLILQGDINGAMDVTGRFMINSTVGVLGLFDLASQEGIQKRQEDFGQTLGVWGVPAGPFIMLPFLGPTSLRDLIASPLDVALTPPIYSEYGVEYFASTRSLGLYTARTAAGNHLAMARQQLDPYTAVKRGYLVYRESLVRNGQSGENAYENLPSFDEFGDF